MTGANPVEILLMKTFFRGLIAQIARLLPVDDAFAIRFA